MREGIKGVLSVEGHAVRTARDGEDALAKMSERRPDVVLLDVMMPKMNGFKCCEEIRRRDALVPVIFLTAKDSEADQIRGFGLGADDYISKSAPEAVLLARLERALQRAKSIAGGSAAKDGELRFGKVRVDLCTWSVFDDGREISRLTKTECDLLQFLVAHRGEVFVIDDLITELRGNGFACTDAMLYSHISHLRGKLGSAANCIALVRGRGYGFVE